MQPRMDTPCRELYSRIVAGIENGGRLSRRVLGYIETSLFSPDPDSLAAFLADDDDCERDSLLDLIFFPDHDLQIDIEPLLESRIFSREDEETLDRLLVNQTVTAPIHMPDGRLLIHITVPDFIKSQFVRRLNLSWQLDLSIKGAIDKGVPKGRQTLVKVRLRNANVRFSPTGQALLCRFFERMPGDDRDYLPGLDLVLTFSKSNAETEDLYEIFAEHKRFLFRSLQQAKRFEAMLARSNMETMMAQGFRATHASKSDLLQRMLLLDGICYRLFGRTEIICSPLEEPLRHVPDIKDAVFP